MVPNRIKGESFAVTTTKLSVKPVPPFSFDLSARIFADGDSQFCRYEDGKFWRLIRIVDRLGLITVESSGSASVPEILFTLSSDRSLTDIDLQEACRIVNLLFNTGLDLKPFYRKVQTDPVMKILAHVLRGLRSPSTPTVFEALVDSIIEQQIALSVGITMEHRLIKSFGDSLTLDGKVYFAFPTPEKLAFMTTEQSRKIGLSTRKAEYIKGVSQSIVDGKLDLEKFKTYKDTQQIIRELDTVRGIGVWTAELTVIRSMQKFDVIPADDLGLRRVISHYYCDGKEIWGDDAREIAQRWGKWRGLAAFYLIMAEETGVKIQASSK